MHRPARGHGCQGSHGLSQQGFQGRRTQDLGQIARPKLW